MDFQIIAFNDIAPISKVGYAEGPAFAALELDGRGFIHVAEVLINGQPSPEFMVLSERKIIAQIPTTQLTRALKTVTVLTADAGASNAAVINFRQAGGRQEASGMTYLIQSFLMILLATRGSDLFNPEVGAGLLTLVGSIASDLSIRAQVSQAISTAASQMIAMQSGQAIPLEDQLASARLLEARYEIRTATVSIRVQLYSAAGTTADAGLQLPTRNA